MPTTITMTGPGTTTLIDDTALAITTLLGPTAATSLPFSIPALLSAIEEDNQAVVRQLMTLNENVETLTGAIQGVSEQLKLGNFATTKIGSSLNEMTVNEKMALAETRRNNAFQQQTTNAALVEAGKPPTEVKPQDIQLAIQQTIQDYSLQQAQVKAIGLFEEGASTVINYAVQATNEALVATGIADFFSENLLKLKVAVVGIFCEKQAARILEEAKLKATKAKRNPVIIMRTARVNIDVAKGQKIISGSSNVYVNDQPLALQGSAKSNGSTVVAGSTDVYANNRQVARKADSFSDGSNITTGSPTVFTNSPND